MDGELLGAITSRKSEDTLRGRAMARASIGVIRAARDAPAVAASPRRSWLRLPPILVALMLTAGCAEVVTYVATEAASVLAEVVNPGIKGTLGQPTSYCYRPNQNRMHYLVGGACAPGAFQVSARDYQSWLSDRTTFLRSFERRPTTLAARRTAAAEERRGVEREERLRRDEATRQTVVRRRTEAAEARRRAEQAAVEKGQRVERAERAGQEQEDLADARRALAEERRRRAAADRRVAELEERREQRTPDQTGLAVTSTGTGFLVGSPGKVLTNNHVIEGCRKISVQQIGEQPVEAIIVSRDETNDLALLASSVSSRRVAPFPPTETLRMGDEVVTFGFPLFGALSSRGNLTEGIVTALAGLADDTRILQISVPVQPGNSGGPLIDNNGNVVGVVVAKINAMRVAEITGDIPQNVNFAIKSSVVRSFLTANGVSVAIGRTDEELSVADIGERATKFTVLVQCLG